MIKKLIAFLVLIPLTAEASYIPMFTLPPNGVYRITNNALVKHENKPIKLNIHITISATFVMGKKRAVLIGTKIYKEGDKVDGMVIKKIMLDKVIFKRGDDDYEVDMNDPLAGSGITVKNGEVVQQ